MTQSSLCEVEIVVPNNCIWKLHRICNHAADSGIEEVADTVKVYNDITTCVLWLPSLITKDIKHPNLRKLSADSNTVVCHIPCTITQSGMFTKELKCAPHFFCLHSIMMMSKRTFDAYHHVVPVYIAGHLLPYCSTWPRAMAVSFLLVSEKVGAGPTPDAG